MSALSATRSRLAAIGLGLIVGSVSFAPGAPTPVARAATTPANDGSAMDRAAASCWEIKQDNPAAADGIYWLVTPQLVQPDQFYCDMTTDGGGWVLVARGREGWRSEYEGQGTVAEVRSVVDGPAAFRVRQLPSTVVDGLLGGQRVDALPDGVRLRRATAVDGSTRQEVRFRFVNRDRWIWTFRGRHPLRSGSMTFDGAYGGVGNTLDFGTDSVFNRVNTELSPAQGWTGGFAFGTTATGVTGPDSYVWSAKTGASNPRPFTQMYLRPKLRTADLTYPTVPAGGLAASTRRALPETRAVPTGWGVAGLAGGGGISSELRSEVQAFAQIGNVMYVGGNFATVQRDAAGTGAVPQPFLAGFDITTGEFVSGFRPVLNEQVKALTALPNGLLAVGGEFTTLNGAPAAGVAVLDPLTGAAAPGFALQVENRLTNGVLSVRSLKVSGGYLYLGGAFTHLNGGSRGTAYARAAGRVDYTTGLPDQGWNPAFNGAVNEITPAATDPRVYAAGYFTASNATAVDKLAAVSTAAGAPVLPWATKFSVDPAKSANFQFTVSESAARVWAGGSQHSLFSYARGPLTFASGGIAMSGGDFQTSFVDRATDTVYGGCHCNDWFYSGPTIYGWPYNFAQGDKLGFVGAFDGTTGAFLPEFDPILDARAGYGAWASTVDSRGTLWVGGSFASSVTTSGRAQWSGGFVRFAPRDITPPPPPSDLASAFAGGVTGSTVSLSWSASAEAGVLYEVLADGRVVATSTATTLSVSLPERPTGYVVRAVDPAGNRSASTPVVTVDPALAPVSTVLVAPGAVWSWRFDGAPLNSDWAGPGFADADWATGASPLGYGSSPLGTTITAPGTTPPLTAQFRRGVDVPDPTALGTVTITVPADDGVIVFLNGTEIGRKNLADGPITQNSYATLSPRTGTARANPLVLTIPGTQFVTGRNVLAAQTHLGYRATRDISFDLTAVGVRTP
ncbi:MAG: hypothetical protein LCH98_17675 [Actinobacteria bacterium]|nr:hypothetical protein [Actinomycetota bacterium]